MPNWVRNKVKFGSKKIMEDFYTNENENENFDFEKIIPMPKTMHLTSGGKENIAISYALSLMSKEEQEKVIKVFKETNRDSFFGSYYDTLLKGYQYSQEEYEKKDKELKDTIKGKKQDIFDNVDYKGLGIKDLKDLGNTYINNILEYGYDTWYDWSYANWGTKWGACHCYYVDEDSIEFDTANGCPYQIFKEISRKYKTRVEVDFADEDIGSNCGTLIFENGKEIEFEIGDDIFAYKVWGYTQEEIDEMKNEE